MKNFILIASIECFPGEADVTFGYGGEPKKPFICIDPHGAEPKDRQMLEDFYWAEHDGKWYATADD